MSPLDAPVPVTLRAGHTQNRLAQVPLGGRASWGRSADVPQSDRWTPDETRPDSRCAEYSGRAGKAVVGLNPREQVSGDDRRHLWGRVGSSLSPDRLRRHWLKRWSAGVLVRPRSWARLDQRPTSGSPTRTCRGRAWPSGVSAAICEQSQRRAPAAMSHRDRRQPWLRSIWIAVC